MERPKCTACGKTMEGHGGTSAPTLSAWYFKCECGCMASFICHKEKEIDSINFNITYKGE